MTRINTIPPADLADQHLMAEYRELPRVITLAARALERNGGEHFGRIPERYTMGKGHVRFFYDKTAWLCQRHAVITAELFDRGYNLAPREPLQPLQSIEWTPTAQDMATNLERLRSKVSARRNFYRFWSAVVDCAFYNRPAASYAGASHASA